MNNASIKNLHKKAVCDKTHPDRFLDLVWTHGLIVRKICLDIVDNLDEDFSSKIDKELLENGALIHDIGVYFCFDEDFNPDKSAPAYFYHGREGEKFLRLQGIKDDKLIRFSSVHIGVGITKEDIKREGLDLPNKDFIPLSLEERILTYADKFHTKSPAFVSFDQAKDKLEKIDVSKGLKMEMYKKEFGLPSLNDLEKEYEAWHKDFDSFWKKISS
ncbi:MAG: HD domain-containing protein [Parcubacteria group bacterium]|nr:HD domain-containing protein [Parcubacteria group bacterium]